MKYIDKLEKTEKELTKAMNTLIEVYDQAKVDGEWGRRTRAISLINDITQHLDDLNDWISELTIKQENKK